jgi:hypothetical protein
MYYITSTLISYHNMILLDCMTNSSIDGMRRIVELVEKEAEDNKVSLRKALEKTGVSKTRYYEYKEKLRLIKDDDKDMQANVMAKQTEDVVPLDPDYIPELITTHIPDDKEDVRTRHRLSVDLPLHLYGYLEEEHEYNMMSIKNICQKILIDYLTKNKEEGKHVF